MGDFKRYTKQGYEIKNLYDLKEPQKAIDRMTMREKRLCTSPKDINKTAKVKKKTTQARVKKDDKKPSKNVILQPFKRIL